MQRRHWLAGIAAVCAASCVGMVSAQQRQRGTRKSRVPMPKYPNTHFYNSDGSFNEQAARDAFAELFRYHNYSLAEVILADKKNFWVVDFALGDFANTGMGGILFINDKEHGYFGHEIYLLPGQMIPEHYHLAAEGKPAKHEAWQVRYGSIHTMSKGGTLADVPKEVTLPESQLNDNAITCFRGEKQVVGNIELLANLEEPHFMIAGPEGAIVTEYASYHSGEGIRFTNTKAKM